MCTVSLRSYGISFVLFPKFYERKYPTTHKRLFNVLYIRFLCIYNYSFEFLSWWIDKIKVHCFGLYIFYKSQQCTKHYHICAYSSKSRKRKSLFNHVIIISYFPKNWKPFKPFVVCMRTVKILSRLWFNLL